MWVRQLRRWGAAARWACTAAIVASAVLSRTHALQAQHKPPSLRSVAEFALRAHRDARAGVRVAVPSEIAKGRAVCDESSEIPCDLATSDQMRAFQFTTNLRSGRGLAIQGIGEKQCSPTGNCSFWILRRLHGKYETILNIDMVQTFRFLNSQTHGYPDLVTWSHDSAMERGGRLFRFDGQEYRESVSWDEDYERRLDDGSLETLKRPQVTLFYWDGETLPD